MDLAEFLGIFSAINEKEAAQELIRMDASQTTDTTFDGYKAMHVHFGDGLLQQVSVAWMVRWKEL